jgi:hypothetical protein
MATDRSKSDQKLKTKGEIASGEKLQNTIRISRVWVAPHGHAERLVALALGVFEGRYRHRRVRSCPPPFIRILCIRIHQVSSKLTRSITSPVYPQKPQSEDEPKPKRDKITSSLEPHHRESNRVERTCSSCPRSRTSSSQQELPERQIVRVCLGHDPGHQVPVPRPLGAPTRSG